MVSLHACSLLASLSRKLNEFLAIGKYALTLHSLVCKVIHATTGDWFFSCQACQYNVGITRLPAMQALKAGSRCER